MDSHGCHTFSTHLPQIVTLFPEKLPENCSKKLVTHPPLVTLLALCSRIMSLGIFISVDKLLA
jgi:hypothetical protein